jgi:hypothetical protein
MPDFIVIFLKITSIISSNILSIPSIAKFSLDPMVKTVPTKIKNMPNIFLLFLTDSKIEYIPSAYKDVPSIVHVSAVPSLEKI